MVATTSSLEERVELLVRCQWMPDLSRRQMEHAARYLRGAKTAKAAP